MPDELRAACGRPRWVALALAMLVMGARVSQPDAGMLTAIAGGTKLVSYGQVLGPVLYEVPLPEHRTRQIFYYVVGEQIAIVLPPSEPRCLLFRC